MPYQQITLTLPPHTRGIHVITSLIRDAIRELIPSKTEAGLVHLFLQHTSASLAINENADPDVRLDAEDWLNKIAPANQPEYRHTFEGSDDLPAHFKSMMFGVSLTVPLVNGVLGLGTWQGIYLCEHRDHGGQRRLIITVST
ncbi:secondary thiamine-phosphate synthase enzyme YjbQ [Psychrobacter sp. 72-O-c]|uniref:secondary thiamine-phosphate synthase enzyme YjbQ n=1 Tax=Psychrobacter sp. 72-O-c TaxID=2774125 RepID=UPI001917E4C1|nr:secondary thiamine-phosphate synthase enzyme YjbQ [Psychrobacter sp. 72-O-c]